MRFVAMVKSAEGQGPPPQALMTAVAQSNEQAARDGVIVRAGGLGPTVEGALVRLSGGKLTVIDGPFAEAKEVIGGYAVLELASRQAAVESATHLLELHRRHWPGWTGEVEIRPITELPDIAGE